jgi:hypothetical protein
MGKNRYCRNLKGEIFMNQERRKAMEIAEELFKKSRSNWPLFALSVAAFFSWTAWSIVVNNSSPFSSPEIAIPLFYATFFFATASTFALFGAFFRASFLPYRSVARSTNMAVRQGMIFASVCNIGLLFQQYGVLSWWIATLLLIMGVLIEISFISRED